MPKTQSVADEGHPFSAYRGRVLAEEATRTPFHSAASDVVRDSAARAMPATPEPLGAFGGLARILAAKLREPREGPSGQGRARAHADHLLETIRSLSAL
jgi:hypothetical protein